MSQYEKEESSDRYSLRGKVFHQLREDILSGHYKEHEELREMAISEEMGVSRTPVREALRQLELEGLVSIIPNKGAYVTGITRKDVEDIYAIRSLLEGLCAVGQPRILRKNSWMRWKKIFTCQNFTPARDMPRS